MRKRYRERDTQTWRKVGLSARNAMRKGNKRGMTGGKPRKKEVTITKLQKDLWELCRTIVKARYGNTCYTCGAIGLSGSNWQTGHFISKSICSTELAYHLDNLRPQCAACNIWKSGNWIAFEAHLIVDHGREFPDELKAENQRTKGLSYGKDWYQNKIIEYTQLLDLHEKHPT